LIKGKEEEGKGEMKERRKAGKVLID